MFLGRDEEKSLRWDGDGGNAPLTGTASNLKAFTPDVEIRHFSVGSRYRLSPVAVSQWIIDIVPSKPRLQTMLTLYVPCNPHSILVNDSLEPALCAGRPAFDCRSAGRDECHNRRYGSPDRLPTPRRVVCSEQRTSFAVLQESEHSLLLQTVFTLDRWNKTTHYTSVHGATASLTFVVEYFCPTARALLMSRLQGAVYVQYVGYPMKGVASPALIPITLQPWHGKLITVQSDASRPQDAQAQTILFSSDKLDPTETYTITIMKTNATLDIDLNIDSFILTQLDPTFSPPGTSFSASASAPASNLPLPPFVVPTTVIDGTTLTGPVVSLCVPGATSTLDGTFAQSNSTSSSNPSNTGAIAGAIAGGVLGGIAIGIIAVFLIFRWWPKRVQRKQSKSGAVPAPWYTPRPVYLGAAAPYPSEYASVPPQTMTTAVIDHQSVPSRLVGASPPLTLADTAPRQSSVNMKRIVAYAPRIQAITRNTGNTRPNNLASASQPPVHVVPLPEDIERGEAMPPAYS